MRNLTRLIAITAIAVAPAVSFSASASAQTAPPYYEEGPTATETASDVRSAASKAIAKLSAKSLLKGSKSIKLNTTNDGPGKYEIRLTRKEQGKTVTVASGSKTVTNDTTKSATLKIKLTAKGKALLKKLKAAKLKLSLEASFTPKGEKKKTSKSSLSLKKG